MRWLAYKILCDWWGARLINHQATQIIVGAIAAAYYAAFDHWGAGWPLQIGGTAQFYNGLLVAMLVAALVTLLFNGFAKIAQGASETQPSAFYSNFIKLLKRVVNYKVDRFRTAVARMGTTRDLFKEITQPKVQIDYIIKEIETFLMASFNLSDNAVCITVIREDPEGKVYYLSKTHSWEMTKAGDVLGSKISTASSALERGEPVFHVSKEKAAEAGLYHLSDRDKRMGDGSIYCYPVKVPMPEYTERFAISIVSYGTRLVQTPGKELEDAVARIFGEFCLRVELELILLVMKDWRYTHSKVAV